MSNQGKTSANAAALKDRLDSFPIIAAVRDDRWEAALASPAEVLFYLECNLLTMQQKIREAHDAEKILFVHMDLSDGIGKDRAGLAYLAQSGVDGIISTKAQLIRAARELGLLTIQRFFALDSQGMGSVLEVLKNANPHFMEIMPGVIPKVIQRLSKEKVPVIAGGLIETKAEVTAALRSGATAISTGRPELWEL